MDLEVKKDLEISPSLTVGDRRIFVACERLVISAWESHLIFGMLISPIYIMIIEHNLQYAISLQDGTKVNLEELFLKYPSLKEKLFSIQNQFGSGLELEFSNDDESFEF